MNTDKNEKIEKAMALLHENGYIVIKLTKEMEEDSDKCEACGGGDCLACSCSMCVVQ